MKRNFILFSCLVLLVVFGFGLYLFKNSLAVSDNPNESLIGEVAKLEGYAKEYIENQKSGTNSTVLTLDYLRQMRYNDAKWNTLLGTPDEGFIEYVQSKGGVNINEDDYLIDATTYKKIDFIHMTAVLDCYYKHGDSLKYNSLFSISTDYAGWAGDLLTLMTELYTYRTANTITDKDILIKYANSLIGTNKQSSFTSEDMYADIDALNLYKAQDLDLANLSEALSKYYVTTESKYNYKNRVESARQTIGEDEATIKKKASDLLKNSIVQAFLIKDFASKLEELDYEVASSAFSNYLLENPYLEITSTMGRATVGDEDIQVPIYESNLGIPNISMSKDICEIEVLDDIIYIRPTNAGESTITISSFNNKSSVTYTLTAFNVAPSIIKQPDDLYNLSSGIESTISIIASGTNNTYTWYIGNSKEGEFTKLGVTAIPSFTFKPTMDMDGKYIKCEISNEGNDKVTTNISLLKVKNVSLGEIVATGDMQLKVGISIIFLVLCSNIFVYAVRKYRYDLFD